MALVGVELQTLVSEPGALTTRPPQKISVKLSSQIRPQSSAAIKYDALYTASFYTKTLIHFINLYTGW